MVGQLAGGIAHDFNNVLSAIMMANDFLLNAHKPTDPSFQDIMQIKQNANRAASAGAATAGVLAPPDAAAAGARSRRRAVRPHHAAAPADRREGQARPRARPRSLAGQGRRLAVRAGDRQSRGQRARRDARRRQADGAHRQCDGGRSRAARLQGHAGGRLCAGRGRPTPAPASRPRSSTRSSSRSSRPRRSARAPGSASRRSTASSSRPAASSMSDSEPGEGTTFRIFLPRHRPELEAAARSAGRQRRGQGRGGRAAEAAARSDRAGHHPAGRGRGGPALAQCARPALARLQRDRGRQRRRGDGGAGREGRRGRSRRLRRGDAGDGRPDAAARKCASAIRT